MRNGGKREEKKRKINLKKKILIFYKIFILDVQVVFLCGEVLFTRLLEHAVSFPNTPLLCKNTFKQRRGGGLCFFPTQLVKVIVN